MVYSISYKANDERKIERLSKSSGMSSSKLGKTTLTDKLGTGMDPIETLILREGLRVVDVHLYKELDLLAVVLSSGDILQARI